MKLILAASLLLVLALVAGCGGGTVSGLAGNWNGTYTTSTGQTGTISGFVTSSGVINGTVHNNTTGEDGNISGAIVPTGTSSLTFSYGSGTSTATGSLLFTTKQLTGSLKDTSGTTYTIALTQS